jgi:hypothetical protein
MIVVTPDTSSISFSIRTRPSASYTPFATTMYWQNADTQVTGSVVLTASYDSNDFLNVTASLYVTNSYFYNFQIFQMSSSGTSSVACNELYRGELYGTTMNPLINNSVPFSSYTGTNNEYIIF